MRTAHLVVNSLVVGVALFFTYVGLRFLLVPLMGQPAIMEGAPDGAKSALGVVFLLAAAPMFYYAFAKSARALPPARKKSPPAPPQGKSPPS